MYESPLGLYVHFPTGAHASSAPVPRAFADKPLEYHRMLSAAYPPLPLAAQPLSSAAAAASDSSASSHVVSFPPAWNLAMITMSAVLATAKLLMALVRALPLVTPQFFTEWRNGMANAGAAAAADGAGSSASASAGAGTVALGSAGGGVDIALPAVARFRPQPAPNTNVPMRLEPTAARTALFRRCAFVYVSRAQSNKMRDVIETAGGSIHALDLGAMQTELLLRRSSASASAAAAGSIQQPDPLSFAELAAAIGTGMRAHMQALLEKISDNGASSSSSPSSSSSSSLSLSSARVCLVAPSQIDEAAPPGTALSLAATVPQSLPAAHHAGANADGMGGELSVKLLQVMRIVCEQNQWATIDETLIGSAGAYLRRRVCILC